MSLATLARTSIDLTCATCGANNWFNVSITRPAPGDGAPTHTITEPRISCGQPFDTEVEIERRAPARQRISR